MLSPDPFSEPPAFINPEGVKWWRDTDTDRYTASLGLKGITCWLVEKPNGYRSRIILKDGQYEYVTTGLEDAAVHLDMLRVHRDYTSRGDQNEIAKEKEV